MCPNQLCSLAILLSCTCCFVVVVVVVVFFQVSCYRTYSRATRGAYFTRLWRCSVIVCTTFSRTTGSPYCLTSTRWLPSRTQTRINSTSGKLPGSTHCVENPDNFPLLACENSRLALGGFRPPPPSRETKSARCEAAVFAGYSSSFCGFADKLGKGLLSMRSWAIMKSGPETVTRQWVIHGFRELVINDRRKES